MRNRICLNPGWLFVRKDVGAEALDKNAWVKWEKVDLPHTWNASDGADGSHYHQGACWYKRIVSGSITDTGKRVYLEFLGANSVADVYVNHKRIGQHRGGYSTFRFDVTGVWQVDGENELLVKVDNTSYDDVYPQTGDFTFFGGLYRDVNLVVTHNVHFSLLDAGSPGVCLVQDQVRPDHALLTIRALVTNDLNVARSIRLWVEILARDGHVAAYGARDLMLEASRQTEVLLPIQLDEPILWDGVDNPYLYTVCASLQGYNEILDEISFDTGLRSFAVDPNRGFLLNGRPYRLQGVARHQDRKDVGWAISRQDQQQDMALIREIGANAVRLAHYQHDAFFYELCDREGLVVWTEIPFTTAMSRDDLAGTNAKQQLIELIRQNYNHPAICFWGIQNEIQISGDHPETRHLVSELNALAKFEDPTRLTAMSNLMTVPANDPYNEVTDVIGYNKYYGWYEGKTEDLGPWLDSFHASRPKTCLGISEYGAEGILQYHSETPQRRDYSEEYQALYHETTWRIISERPWLWGSFVWNMFDFASSKRDEGGIKGRNNKGLVSYGRRLRKDAFYLYKAHWSAEKFVYIASRRYIERDRDRIDIKVYTNCDRVELTVNNSLFGTAAGVDRVVIFENVPLFMGYNLVTAIGFIDGEVLAAELPVNRKNQAVFTRVEAPNPNYVVTASAHAGTLDWFRNTILPNPGTPRAGSMDLTDRTERAASADQAARAAVIGGSEIADISKNMDGTDNMESTDHADLLTWKGRKERKGRKGRRPGR